jgi:hypothetical protein
MAWAEVAAASARAETAPIPALLIIVDMDFLLGPFLRCCLYTTYRMRLQPIWLEYIPQLPFRDKRFGIFATKTVAASQQISPLNTISFS